GINTFEFFNSKAYPIHSHFQVSRMRGNKDTYWINALSSPNEITAAEIADFSIDDSQAICLSSVSGNASASCAGIIDVPLVMPSAPSFAISWSSAAIQNWQDPAFFECPIGFVRALGSPILGTEDFCVMKYEA